MKKVVLIFLLTFSLVSLTFATENKGEYNVISERSTLEIFSGAEIHLRDIYFDQVFHCMIQLSPALRWNAGRGWKVAAQAKITIANTGFGKNEWLPRLGVATVSKEFSWDKFDMKLSGGFFSHERYGLDFKAKYNPTEWVSLEGQVGYTGMVSMVNGWKASKLSRLTAIGGVDFYIRKWQTQIRVRGGQWLYGDAGCVGEVYRHFNHCSIGLYGQYSNYNSSQWEGIWVGTPGNDTRTNNASNISGGFRVIIMIPPYHWSKKKTVRFRPATNFRFNYLLRNANSCANYETDPEENERIGWFDKRAEQWER